MMKRIWRRIEYSQWDNGCGTAKTADGNSLYFYKKRPVPYEVYRDKLMNYFKDYDEDYL